jgi:exodeoxyribonuclease VII small subunit
MPGPAPSNSSEPPSGPRFEEALAQLEQIARDLEDGDLGLEESLARYESGVRLLRQCNELLTKAERKIELLAGVDADGNPVLRPFEVAENGPSNGAEESGKPAEKPRNLSREVSGKPPVRRGEERPAARPKRPTRPGEIDESRELF